MRQTLDIDLTLLDFFDAPTIAQQAVIIEGLLLDEIEAMSDEEAARLAAADEREGRRLMSERRAISPNGDPGCLLPSRLCWRSACRASAMRGLPVGHPRLADRASRPFVVCPTAAVVCPPMGPRDRDLQPSDGAAAEG